jgi:hypothetical protein
MNKHVPVLLFLVAALSGAAWGQNWTVFTPPEGDFKVLFPDAPVRLSEKDGSITFKTQVEESDYTVWHHASSLWPIAAMSDAGAATPVIWKELKKSRAVLSASPGDPRTVATSNS